MSRKRKIIVAAAAFAAAFPVAAMLLLWISPPELVRVGANYTAKTVCSNVFIAGRDPENVLRTDVQAPGHPLLRLMRISVDREHGVVRAGLFGFIGDGLAVIRPQVGCAVLPDGKPPSIVAPLSKPILAPLSSKPWPEGNGVAQDAAIERVIENDTLAGRGMRSIVVVHDGRIVAERYVDDFGPQTPQLGWSMAKTVTAGLIGILLEDGRASLAQPAGWPADDPRKRITIADLMSMSSGLRFDEGYGAVSDVTRMLYLEPDMAAFARAQPLANPVGKVWSYSSGSAVILSRIYQDLAGADAVKLMHERLFEPLGMTSALMETDEHGTLVGSSYLYATPRDWARFGEMLAQDGMWQGREILPRGFVAMMASPVAASDGEYGHGLVWRSIDHRDADGIPADTFWMSGHDGQYAAIIPSRHLVVVRLGLTPQHEHYEPQPLVRALLDIMPAPGALAGNPR